MNCRQTARETARILGFGMIDQSRITTAVSELTRNIIRYATDKRGEMMIRPIDREDGATGIEIIVSDDGPGIEDIEQVLREGYTSGGGLGLGLPGTRRLMDEMHIDSVPGRGTIIAIRKWRR